MTARSTLAPPFADAEVAVFDLDGVVRRFPQGGCDPRLASRLAMSPAGFGDLAFGLPVVRDMVVGRATFAQWVAAIRTELLGRGHEAETVDEVLAGWLADRGVAVVETLALIDALEGRGVPCFVFTNGTDQVPAELLQIGLGRFLPLLINTADLGWAKPHPRAYALAHAWIEGRLGRTVNLGGVVFTDDREANVVAARAFGWRATTFVG